MFERHPLFILGLLLLSAFAGLDIVIRLRMSGIGAREAWWSSWSHGEYLRECPRHGWSKGLFYLAVVFFVSGLACLVLGIWLSS
jgi:hypothetical protein